MLNKHFINKRFRISSTSHLSIAVIRQKWPSRIIDWYQTPFTKIYSFLQSKKICLFTNFCCSVSQTADWQGTKQRGQHVHSRGHHLYNAFHADIPHRHTFQCQLSLLFIICPKTKNHPLLASATRLSPVSFSSHGDASVGGKSAFIQLEVQLTQCVTTRVDIVLLTMSNATAPWKSKSQMSKWWRTPGHSGHTM